MICDSLFEMASLILAFMEMHQAWTPILFINFLHVFTNYGGIKRIFVPVSVGRPSFYSQEVATRESS